MQIICTGHTRLVILVADYAIKIARIRILFCACRTVAILFTGQTRGKVEKWRRERGGALRVVYEAMFAGFFANIQEYRLSRKRSDCEFAETLFSCGIFNIQRRGEPVGETDARAHPLMQAVIERAESTDLIVDTMRPEQFCRINGRVCLADYGNPLLSRFLALSAA